MHFMGGKMSDVKVNGGAICQSGELSGGEKFNQSR